MDCGSWIVQRARAQQSAQAPVWAMSPAERVAAMYAGELSFHQLCAWSSRYPEEVPLLNDEFWFLAIATPEIAEAGADPQVSQDPVADAWLAWERACEAETAAWEAYYERGAPRRSVDAAIKATDQALEAARRTERRAQTAAAA